MRTDRSRCALDEEAVRARIGELRSAGCEALAIGFLFSFLNPTHEQRAASLAEEEWPGVYLSVSSDLLPQVREYERFSTTAVNAYVGPRTATTSVASRASSPRPASAGSSW